MSLAVVMLGENQPASSSPRYLGSMAVDWLLPSLFRETAGMRAATSSRVRPWACRRWRMALPKARAVGSGVVRRRSMPRKEIGNPPWNELDMSRVGDLLVAGIDLSGRTTGTTALAWLAGATSCERPVLDRPVVAERGPRGAGGDERIVSLLMDARPDVVAIDAPLYLPHAIVCRDGSCGRCFPSEGAYPSYTTRKLERKERWSDPPTARPPMPMVMVAGIAFRAIFLRRLLEREDIQVIETWPAGVLRRVQDAPGRASPLDAALAPGYCLAAWMIPTSSFSSPICRSMRWTPWRQHWPRGCIQPTGSIRSRTTGGSMRVRSSSRRSPRHSPLGRSLPIIGLGLTLTFR